MRPDLPAPPPRAGAGYPDNNPKTVEGLKKAQLHLVPPSAIREMCTAMTLGAIKYGPYNWRQNNVAATVYISAALRHLLAWSEGEDTDPESLGSHLGHVMACCAIIIDAQKGGNLIDDRAR